MHRTGFAIALCGALMMYGCTEETKATQQRSLSWEGYGPLRFGMTLQEAQKTAGAPTTPSTSERDVRCDWVNFPSLPDVLFMVEEGVLTRADAKAGVSNSLGITQGMSLEQARAKLPSAVVTPHKYDPTGFYLKVKAPDGKKAIVMETEAGRIDEIRAGLEPSVSYIEGCS